MIGFLLRDYKQGLVYDGTIANIDKTFDPEQAILRYDENYKRAENEIRMFGMRYQYKLPYITNEQIEEQKRTQVTPMFHAELAKQVRIRVMSDVLYGVWVEVLKHTDVYKNKQGKLLFLHKEIATDGSKAFNKEKEGALLLMKEFAEGYTFSTPYQIVIEGSKQPFPIGTDYRVSHPRTGEIITIENNYSAALRSEIFGRAHEAMGYGDDKPLMYARQYDLLKRMGKRTCFTHVRRAGKTIFMALAALRFLLKDNPRHTLRPTSVMYLSLAEKNIQAVVHYLLKMKESFGDVGDQMFHWDSKYNIFSFKKGREVLGTLTFISKFARDAGVGNFVDSLIVDEAPRIPYEVFKDFEPFITHENADFLAGSTMYEDVEKSWFFDYLVEYENASRERFDIDSHIIDWYNKKLADPKREPDTNAGLRYTVDDDENMTQEQKERLKNEYLRKSPARYMTELYSRFPDEGKVFSYGSSLSVPAVVNKQIYKYIIMGFDPALVKDQSAIQIVGYDEQKGRLVILEEHILNSSSTGNFQDQADKIKEIRKTLAGKYSIGEVNNPIFFVMDTTSNQRGTAELLEMVGVPIDLKVAYTTGEFIKTSSVPGELLVPKKKLVNISQILFKENKVLINNENKELIGQLDNFYKITNDRYEGKGDKDDQVNAMMLAFFFAYEHLGLKHDLMVVKPDGELQERQRKLTQKQLIEYNKERKDMREEVKAEEQYFTKYVR